MKTSISLLLLLCGIQPAFAQQTQSRLVSAAADRYQNGAMTPGDSTRYFTSGSNICDLDAGFQHDSDYVFTYDAPTQQFRLTARDVNALIPQGFQRSLHQEAAAGGAMENKRTHRYAYLSGHAVMDTLLIWNRADSSWDFSQLCADTFFDAQHLKVHLFAGWDGKAWAAAAQTRHSYTAAGNPDSVLDLIRDTMTGGWMPSVLLKYTYNSSGRASGDTVFSWDASRHAWRYQFCVGTAYNAAGDTGIQLSYSWDSSNQWALLQRQTMQYGSNGKVLWALQEYNTGSGWLNRSLTRNDYNNYGQLLQSSTQHWNVLRNAWDYLPQSSRSRYHYEEFTPALAVAQAKPDPVVNVYPNPARESVWIDWKGQQRSAVSIRLSDMQGRPLLQWQRVAEEVHEALPTAALPAGIYILQFDCDSQRTQQLLQVLH